MPSPLALIEEKARQAATGDKLYLRRMPPVFELQVPRFGKYLFPLPMPPTSIVEDWPFAVTITPTVGSGLVVDRNGVLMPTIRIVGTMGQRPKLYKGSYFGSIYAKNRELSKHEVRTRTMPRSKLSGHRYLLHLKHSVFGLYSDLCKDPDVAESVVLLLHLPKDGVSYQVEPMYFSMPRDVATRAIWNYEINLTVIGLGSPPPKIVEDRSVLASLRSGLHQFRSALAILRGTLQDLNRIRAELQRSAQIVSQALDDTYLIVTEAQNFIDGAKSFASSTVDRIKSSAARLETAMGDLGAATVINDDVAQAVQRLQRHMDEIAIDPELFQASSTAKTQEAFQRGLGLLTSRDRATLEAAASEDGPRTQAEFAKVPTLPGDLARDNRARELPEEFRQYQSGFEVELSAADTLEALATTYLGDARLWRHIAIMNGLREPYLSEDGLPNTLGSSDRILIPSTNPPPKTEGNPAVLGASPDDPIAIRVLGRDWLVDESEDWVVDEDGGGVDLRVAEGVTCLVQDLRTRVGIVRGSDPLYQLLGIEQVISVGDSEADIEAAPLKVQEALLADPRVEAVPEIQVSLEVDKLAIEASVVVKGLREPIDVQASTSGIVAP